MTDGTLNSDIVFGLVSEMRETDAAVIQQITVFMIDV